MYENRVLQQKHIEILEEIEADHCLKKVIDNVIELSKNLKKGERIIIEQDNVRYLTTVIKLKEGYQNDPFYDISEGEIKSEYYFKLK